MGAKIRVHLVHSQSLIAAGLLRLLKDIPDMQPVLIEACGDQCGHLCMRPEPDVLLLELRVNHDCGFDCIRQIIVRQPKARILVLSELPNGLRPSYALKAGAKGFITYHTIPEQLAFAIREIARGGVYVEPHVAGKMAQTRSGDKADIVALFSDREYQILLLILEAQSSADIAKELHLSEKTISNYHTKILHKLGVVNPIELTRLAIRNGIIKA